MTHSPRLGIFLPFAILPATFLWLASPAMGKTAGELSFAAPLLTTPPVVDGQNTTDKEWQGASRFGGWTDNILGVANADSTVINVGHHQNTLYVRMVYPIPEAFRRNPVFYSESPLKVDVTEEDGPIFQDDYLGFSLSPPGSEDVFVFAVNGNGVKRDSQNGDVRWDGSWQANQTWDKDFWRVEFSLPLQSFAGSGGWGINFIHGARQVENLESIWAFRPAELYPQTRMRLLPSKVSVALLDIGNLNEGSVTLKGWVENHGTEELTLQSEAQVTDAANERTVIFSSPKQIHVLKPGDKQEINADFTASGSIFGDVTLRLKDNEGTPLLVHAFPFVFSRDLKMEARYIPSPKLLQVIINLGAGTAEKVTTGMIKLLSSDTGEEVLASPIENFNASIQRIGINCKAVPAGRYDVLAEFDLGPETVSLQEKILIEDPPEWLNNTAGISDEVLAPWTPLQVTGRTVSCWGRDYTFGNTGFPEQVNILGQNILSGSARISAKVDGELYQLEPGPFQIIENKDTRVSFKTVANAGKVALEANTWIEFDGFVWNTIRFSPATTARLDEMSVEIPLQRKFATLWWSADSVFRLPVMDNAIFAPPEKITSSAPSNFLRLGDEEHGIQFYYESFHGWQVTQTLIPSESEYVIRYTFRPTEPAIPAELAMGYMALPCKPRAPHLRRIDGVGWTRHDVIPKEELQQTRDLFQVRLYDDNWNRHWNYLNFWNENVYEKDFLATFRTKWAKEWEENRHTFAMYIQGGQLDANTPEYRKYRFEWQPIPGKAPYVPPDPKTRDDRHLIDGCTNAQSAVDFFMWHLEKTVKYLTKDGEIPFHAYIDCYGHHNKGCSNTFHGCPHNGRVPVLATREYLKRIYTIYKSVNPLNQVVLHTGGENSLSAASFTDVMLDGEQFRAPYYGARVNDPSLPKNYTRILNLARVRSLIQCYAWGPERYHLYQFWKWTENEPDHARPARAHLWGLLFSHDVPVWSAGTPANIPRAARELGWDERVEFIPYWRQQTGIQVSASVDPVVVSGWKRGDGNLLLLVVNDSDHEDVCRLSVDFKQYGFQSDSIRCRDYGSAGLGYPDSSFMTSKSRRSQGKEPAPEYLLHEEVEVKETVVASGTEFPLEIKQHSYRLLRFTQ